MTRAIALAALGIAMALGSVGCSGGGQPETPGSETDARVQLVEAKCSLCHDLVRVENADYDREAWEDTIGRMEALGLVVNQQERQDIVDYLTERDGSD